MDESLCCHGLLCVGRLQITAAHETATTTGEVVPIAWLSHEAFCGHALGC